MTNEATVTLEASMMVPESIGPIVEAFCALSAGLTLGFYFCWQESVVCLAASPVMIIGNYLGMAF